jgi:hypothetical protein
VQQLRGEAITVRAEGLPEAAAPNLKNKSFTVTAEVESPSVFPRLLGWMGTQFRGSFEFYPAIRL